MRHVLALQLFCSADFVNARTKMLYRYIYRNSLHFTTALMPSRKIWHNLRHIIICIQLNSDARLGITLAGLVNHKGDRTVEIKHSLVNN